ncbi:MAG TPA: DUF2255 family protein [Gaiellaceae bacterium]|nr:DUF2255 family protein [Gaiellaceae bacterium]
MATWTSKELDEIAEAEELSLASVRRDGTHRRPVVVWVVRAGSGVFVRSVNGRGVSWFRGAQARHEARVRVGNVEKDITFVESSERGDEIDAAYRSKYGHRYPTIVPSIVAHEARVATLELVPRREQTFQRGAA